MNNKILLPQLTSLLASASNKPKKQAEAFIKAFFGLITDSVLQAENVKIKGFGTFKVNRVEARKSVNVSTGEDLEIPAHYKLVFIPSKQLAETVNKDFAWLDIIEITDNLSNEELSSVDSEEMADEASDNNPDKNEASDKGAEEKEIISETNIAELEIMKDENLQNQDIYQESDNNDSDEKNLNKTETDLNPEMNKEPEEGHSEGLEVVTPIYLGEPINETKEPENTFANEETKPAEESFVSDQGGEKLGEELEEEFGNIQPIEPFGPIEPNQNEPDQSIPAEDYLTKKDIEHLASKNELNIAKKSFRKIRKEVDEFDSRTKRRVRNGIILMFFLTLALIVCGFFFMYNDLSSKIENLTVQNQVPVEAEEADEPKESKDIIVNSLPQEEIQSESAEPAEVENTVAETTVKEQPAKAEEKAAPTKPSDVIAYDTVTTTRYLTTIAKEHYGNYSLWPYIYKENEDILGHPDRIKPGTKVVVPNLSKYGIDPNNPADIEKAKRLGVEIYKKFSK